eukprot:jgi/Psemu1/50631/gm1.50631_g
MAPDEHDNPKQDNEEDVPITDLFPSFDQALVTFLRDSFDVPKESNSILCEALIASQYRTWSDFLFIEDIDYLTYQDRGTRVPLTRHVQLKLQRFVDFGRRLTEQGLDWEEREHYTKKAFKDYCLGIVKARRASTADGERSTKLIAQLKYESWIRKPRDETTFPVLQNDATFEHWLVQFKAQLDANGINPTTFLDPYWPDHVLTGYPKALHEEQCAFFWTLLRHVFQVALLLSTQAPQPSCHSSLQLPPSGASSKDSVVSSSVRKPFYGASFCPIQKFLYGARKPLYGASFCPVGKPSAYPVRKPLYEAHSMTYDLPTVCITKRHRDAIKIKLYQLHATLLIANWLYDDVT